MAVSDDRLAGVRCVRYINSSMPQMIAALAFSAVNRQPRDATGRSGLEPPFIRDNFQLRVQPVVEPELYRRKAHLDQPKTEYCKNMQANDQARVIQKYIARLPRRSTWRAH